MAKTIDCCGKSLEFKVVEHQHWQAYKAETATCTGCNTYFEKKIGADFAYKRSGDGYVCTEDGEEIEAETVAHAIWDGPFPMSGSGKCQYETVPYCPKHEEKPKFHGTPIEVGPKFR